MAQLDHIAALRRDAPGLLEAAAAADPEATIESCPDWRPIDLVWHIGVVHDFWRAIVGGRLDDPSQYSRPTRPDGDDAAVAFAQASWRALADALAASDPATPVWSWTGHGDVAWVSRRVAQETAVHRFDAERAAGRDYRVEAELAADGIDEVLVDFLPLGPLRGVPPLGGSAHLHCTDVAGEWIVDPDADGGYVVRREHVKGDVAIRGPAHELLMVLWRRLPLDVADVIGDRAVAERLVTRPA